MRGRDAVVTGWEALRAVFHSRGVRSREALAEWIHSQGFPMPRWSAHFSARVQERILNIAIATDARVSAFENLFVQLTLEECQGLEGRAPVPPVPTSRPGPTNNDTFPDRCWEVVDSVDLGAMFEQRFPVLQSCPYHVRGRYRQAARRALEARSHAVRTQDRQGEVRGWKLFCMLPVMLLRRDPGGKVTKEELCHRFDVFVSDEWATLWQEATAAVGGFTPSVASAQTDEKRAAAACRRVQMGEVTRARQCLTRAALAPGNDATLQELQSRRPQEVQRDIPREVLESHPDVPVQLDQKIFMNSLKSAPRGSSPGPGGWTYEHMRVLLDDPDTCNLFFEAASSFAQASLPGEIGEVLMGARRPPCCRGWKRCRWHAHCCLLCVSRMQHLHATVGGMTMGKGTS